MVFPVSMESNLVEEVIIVGGGIAGLSCVNALLDRGVSPLLLEGATIGTPKMCGEFLAPQTVSLLQQWDIDFIQPIQQASFFAKNKKFNLHFQKPAGAISRSEVELSLAQRARKKQGRIRENSQIDKIIPATKNSPYIFSLPNGEEIQARSVIFATGKFGQQTKSFTPLPYFGIKIHFQHIASPETLLMYSMKDAYFGIVPISNQTSNCACLVNRELIEKTGSCKQFFYDLVAGNSVLKSIFENIDITEIDWFESRAPEFQIKKIPTWPMAYWIGDALAGLHPAIGSGFAHGISSAIMAAEFYLQHDPEGYLKNSRKRVKSKWMIGKLMHQLMLNPFFASGAFSLLELNPWMLNLFLKKLEYQ